MKCLSECLNLHEEHDEKLSEDRRMLIWSHLYHATKRFHNHSMLRVFYEKRLRTVENNPFIDELLKFAMEIHRSEFNASIKNHD